jgi:hypothetical protein
MARGDWEIDVPLYYECDPVTRRVNVTSTGSANLEDVLEVIDRQAADGAWSYGMLYDARLGVDARAKTTSGG